MSEYYIFCMDTKDEKAWLKEKKEFEDDEKAQNYVNNLNRKYSTTFYTYWYKTPEEGEGLLEKLAKNDGRLS